MLITSKKNLTRIFHPDREEGAAKPDGARQDPILTQGCTLPYCSSPNLSLTQQPSGSPASPVDQHEISGLKPFLLDRLFIFIMAGGSGERFWPASRIQTPKHLLKLLGEETLLEQTVRRFETIVSPERIFILTNEAQHQATIEALPKHPPENIIAEPAKRDTGPAAALATALALRQNKNAIVGLFPADAMIHDVALFRDQLLEATHLAAEDPALITFAIKPNHPSTSFGYLELGEKHATPHSKRTCFHKVSQFVEKPDLPKAQEFFLGQRHSWNAGMFLWQAESFLEECRLQQPKLATFIERFLKEASPEKLLDRDFSQLPKISVDYAIMENAKLVIAAIAEFDWDDVGHWTALPKHLGMDEQGNTIQASPEKILLHESTNNIVVSRGKTVALCGIKDLVIVQTDDAILICHRDAVENIKKLPVPEELK
jgi:mannose-1-phosphate guanylyltransferase